MGLGVSVAGDVNGPLFEQLLEQTGHVDKRAAELFREGTVRTVRCACMSWHVCFAPGAHMINDLERSGIGEAVAAAAPKQRDEAPADWCHRSNQKLLKQLKEGDRAEHLLTAAEADEKLHRLTGVAPVSVSFVGNCCANVPCVSLRAGV